MMPWSNDCTSLDTVLGRKMMFVRDMLMTDHSRSYSIS
jgi:hypothetical protein